MKANELMIGDWVKSRYGIGKVQSIRYVNTIKDEWEWLINIVINNETFQNYLSLTEIEPIPLTEEILQKNFPTPEEAVWWPLKDDSFRVEMQDDTHLIIGKYNYVHELQHVLRLFGKEGEITL